VATLRDIRRKQRAIGKIREISAAMKIVAQTKLVRAESRMRHSSLYSSHISRMMTVMASLAPDHALVAPRAPGRRGLVVIASDKGLCGSYNMNILRRAEELARAAGNVSLITVGKKATGYFQRRGYAIEFSVVPNPGENSFEETAAIADRIIGRYRDGVWSDVRLVCTTFVSGMRSRVVTVDYLPAHTGAQRESGDDLRLLEPTARQIAHELVPQYLRSVWHSALLSSTASEHGARVASMTAATQNADDMISQLKRAYNDARQTTITSELLDIVSSAEALRRS
jgi:F-type H+-transporting ATPase subunit gamma